MGTTVADHVFARVTALTEADPRLSRAAAIRRVADEMGRSVSSTSSAYYARARRAVPEPAPAPAEPVRPRKARAAGHADASALYAEMLPLVEAGATVEQAARRFGDEDSVAEIAAGFTRWMDRDQPAKTAEAEAGEAAGIGDGVRLAELEAENRALRRELAQARQAIQRARVILDTSPPG